MIVTQRQASRATASRKEVNTGDLTTLTNVQAWLGGGDAAILARMVSAVSVFIQSWLNRRIAFSTYMELRDGSGRGRGRYVMQFANYPAQDMLALSVNNQAITASSDGALTQPGYAFDERRIWVCPGFCGFERGIANVRLMYNAGFVVTQVFTVPSSPYQVTVPTLWLLDRGVSNAGVPMVKVASSPAAGQYTAAAGVYTFSVADAGAVVAITYANIPADIEQAAIDMIGVRYKEKDRIGQVSKAVGTETVSFTQKDMSAATATLLMQYRKVVPL